MIVHVDIVFALEEETRGEKSKGGEEEEEEKEEESKGRQETNSGIIPRI